MTYQQRRRAFKTDVKQYVLDLKVRHQILNVQVAEVLKEMAKEFEGEQDATDEHDEDDTRYTESRRDYGAEKGEPL